ncbi:hypothetical protein K1719_034660 [Acacia pycnantha]|nr:hypothetical protein K1719_034660 [Acacia pycnantha]
MMLERCHSHSQSGIGVESSDRGLIFVLGLSIFFSSFAHSDFRDIVNEVMETNGGKKKSSSSKSLFYEAPLSYTIEDLRPNGGIKKFKSAAYSNCARQPS